MERRSFFTRVLGVIFPFFAKATAPPPDGIQSPPTFWYENKEGDRWIPGKDYFRDGSDAPPGFVYLWTADPCRLHESCCTTDGPVMSGSSGWSEDLVLAMAHSGYSLRTAIMIVGTSCERCMNALAFEHGLKWGYSRNSGEYRTNGTSCNMCVPRYAPADATGIMKCIRS